MSTPAAVLNFAPASVPWYLRVPPCTETGPKTAGVRLVLCRLICRRIAPIGSKIGSKPVWHHLRPRLALMLSRRRISRSTASAISPQRQPSAPERHALPRRATPRLASPCLAMPRPAKPRPAMPCPGLRIGHGGTCKNSRSPRGVARSKGGNLCLSDLAGFAVGRAQESQYF
jgi:hypothetical protein